MMEQTKFVELLIGQSLIHFRLQLLLELMDSSKERVDGTANRIDLGYLRPRKPQFRLKFPPDNSSPYYAVCTQIFPPLHINLRLTNENPDFQPRSATEETVVSFLTPSERVFSLHYQCVTCS